MPNLLHDKNPQELLVKIQSESAKNTRLIGHFRLRGTGLKKLLGSIELDIIAKHPHYLYLSIESFFKQPARIVTYDGARLYGLEKDKLEAILTLPIEPEELVKVLLRGSQIDPKIVKTLGIEDSSLKITYRSGAQLSLWITPNYQIQKRELRDSSDRLIYSVTYEDFPNRFHLEANYKNQKHAMTLTSHDAKLNQGVFDEQLFRR